MNLATLIAHHARHRAGKTAVESREGRLTYGELQARAMRIAARLEAAGVARGDLVGLRLRDTPDHVAGLIATMHLGGILLPLDWRATAAEVARVTGRFRPRAILADGPRGLPEGVVAVFLDGIEAEAPSATPAADLAGAPLVYSLTSGTTGEPKGIVLTHEQMHARAVALALEGIVRADDRFLAQLPLAYSVGRVVSLGVLSIGATLAMFPTLAEPAELVTFARERQVTSMMLAPNVGRQLIQLPSGGDRLLPDLRVLVFGGAKLQPEERAALRERVAPNIVDYYGSTGGGPTSLIDDETPGSEPTSMGRPLIGMEVEIAGEDDLPLPAGSVGRVRVRGAGVTTAFAGTVEAGDEGIRGGWYYPGDLGSMDAAGHLHLHGRASELIKRGGVMVYAQEVELALRRHPDVADAAVVGAPSATLGQEVVAFVTLRAPVEATALLHHCRRELAPFKVPARYEVVDALPRNASGKVVKAELLKQLGGPA